MVQIQVGILISIKKQMKINTPKQAVFTHEGAKVSQINPRQELERTVMSCLLWEDNFYEDGINVADRIAGLIPKVKPEVVATIAKDARNKQYLRHVPLWIARQMARLDSHKALVGDVLAEVIQRPDELAEFLSLYWKDCKQPLSNQVKKGLARAFTKFNEYSLAKYNRDNAIKLRDVLFLCHAKPLDAAQDELWKKLINDQLTVPDTWETELSASKDKKASWTRLLEQKKLGGLALLRNLRNIIGAGVPNNLIKESILGGNFNKVLPFRFIAASKYAPQFEPELEKVMLQSLKGASKIKGRTVLMIDVSGSMTATISGKSDLSRIDAANALAILAREICEDVAVYTFDYHAKLVPLRRGFGLRDAIMQNFGGGTFLKRAMEEVNAQEQYDQMIIFTDEQSSDGIGEFKSKGFICNVAAYQNGVGYGKSNVTHINGFSESVMEFIARNLES